MGLEPVAQGGVHARLPAFAGSLEGFHDIGVVAHGQYQLGGFGLRAATGQRLS